MKRLGLVVAVLGLVSTASFGQTAIPKATIEIGSTSVAALGVRPGATVVWIAASRERAQWITEVRCWGGASTVADASGRAVLDVGSAIPVKSIWVAVDLTTGAFVASSPPAYPWKTQVPFPSAGIAPASGGVGVAAIRDPHNDLEVLVVRPKAGAWTLTTHHDDAENKGVAGAFVNFAKLTALAGSPTAPPNLGAGDVIVAIDPERMEYFAQQLGVQY